MFLRPFTICALTAGLLFGANVGDVLVTASAADAKPSWPSAEIVVEYRDAVGRELKHWQKFRIEDAKVVSRLAAHFPGVLGESGSGPRVCRGWKSRFTILFYHRTGDKRQMRAVHFSPDYKSWWWRDNTPYTGDRPVAGVDNLRKLIEQLARKHKVDLR